MKLNQYIDHTVLKATATTSDVSQLCAEAKAHEFFSVHGRHGCLWPSPCWQGRRSRCVLSWAFRLVLCLALRKCLKRALRLVMAPTKSTW